MFELANKQAVQLIDDLDLDFVQIEYTPPTNLCFRGEVRILVRSLTLKFIATLKEKGHTIFKINIDEKHDIYDIELSNSPALVDDNSTISPYVTIRYVDINKVGIQ